MNIFFNALRQTAVIAEQIQRLLLKGLKYTNKINNEYKMANGTNHGELSKCLYTMYK